MNILILSWRDPKHPLAGGAEQVVLEHAKGWIAAGNTVTWFSSRFPNSAIYENINGVDIVRKGYQYLGVQITAFFYYLKNRDKYDLVVDQFHGIPFFTPLYVAKPRLALIQEVAGKVWLLNPLPIPLNLIVGVLGFAFEPLIFLLYKNTPFMTGSDSAKDEVSKFGIESKNITVVPHGVILPKKIIKYSKPKIPVITYLGILSRDKGIEDVIDCFSILSKRSDCEFWIVGKPETDQYFEKIKNKVRELGLGSKIRFWGYVGQEKKFELLGKSTALVNASVHEGWGLVNIEANLMGTPVVSYNAAGLVDSVKDGQSGVIVKHNTPRDMANEIVSLLSQGEKYKILSKGSLIWSQRFSWDTSKKASLELIKKIVN